MKPQGRPAPEYVYLKGGEYVTAGTIRELATELGVKESTLHWYRSPAYRRRAAEYAPNRVVEVVLVHEYRCSLCVSKAARVGRDEDDEPAPMCHACYEEECGWGVTA